jgi:hypothetical protein
MSLFHILGRAAPVNQFVQPQMIAQDSLVAKTELHARNANGAAPRLATDLRL